MWEPTRLLYGEGRRPGRQRGLPLTTRHAPGVSPGYWRRHACTGRSDATREAPSGESRELNRRPVRARPGRPGWRRGSEYRGSRVTPVEGRDPSSRPMVEGAESREIGASLSTPFNGSDASEAMTAPQPTRLRGSRTGEPCPRAGCLNKSEERRVGKERRSRTAR